MLGTYSHVLPTSRSSPSSSPARMSMCVVASACARASAPRSLGSLGSGEVPDIARSMSAMGVRAGVGACACAGAGGCGVCGAGVCGESWTC